MNPSTDQEIIDHEAEVQEALRECFDLHDQVVLGQENLDALERQLFAKRFHLDALRKRAARLRETSNDPRYQQPL